MQTQFSTQYKHSYIAEKLEPILRKCVHCGFCNATCPTYQLLGDELDGPRGRIYQIKKVLEGDTPNAQTRLHLDRCLLCRNCETTCPSGVNYSELLEHGKNLVISQTETNAKETIYRKLVSGFIQNKTIFKCCYETGRFLRSFLPEKLKSQIIPKQKNSWTSPKNQHKRKMVVLDGCAQSVITPQTNLATANVFDKLGISLISVPGAGCCGAVSLHTNHDSSGLETVKKLIDKWWPYASPEYDGFITSASGCGLTIKEYPKLFDPSSEYYEKAREIAEKTYDVVEVISQEIDQNNGLTRLQNQLLDKPQDKPLKVVFHPPCTLQHGQKITGKVEKILSDLGYQVLPFKDPHLCCGSAGTYSLFQKEISEKLRDNKLNAIQSVNPDIICTANIGCQIQLSNYPHTPVKHWIELLL